MKTIYSIIILIVLFFTTLCSYAQELDTEGIKFFVPGYYDNGININQGAELREYFETVKSINKKRDGFYGYRVKIFAETGRKARSRANDLRVNFNSEQDTVKAYVVYLDPNFEVHAGDFRTKLEAASLLKKLSEDYSEAYVVKTIINFPELED